MTVLTSVVPRLGRSIGRARAAHKRTSPVTVPAVVKNLAAYPLTVMGLSSIVAAVILISLVAGLIVLGVSLMALEYLIADEDQA